MDPSVGRRATAGRGKARHENAERGKAGRWTVRRTISTWIFVAAGLVSAASVFVDVPPLRALVPALLAVSLATFPWKPLTYPKGAKADGAQGTVPHNAAGMMPHGAAGAAGAAAPNETVSARRSVNGASPKAGVQSGIKRQSAEGAADAMHVPGQADVPDVGTAHANAAEDHIRGNDALLECGRIVDAVLKEFRHHLSAQHGEQLPHPARTERSGRHSAEAIIRAAETHLGLSQAAEQARRVMAETASVLRSEADAAAQAAREARKTDRDQPTASDAKSLAAELTDLSEIGSVLAINASIEAARAGTAGRGFGVIAGEMHSFAERVARFAEEIKSAEKRRSASPADSPEEGNTSTVKRGPQSLHPSGRVLEMAAALDQAAVSLRDKNEAVQPAETLRRACTVLADATNRAGAASDALEHVDISLVELAEAILESAAASLDPESGTHAHARMGDAALGEAIVDRAVQRWTEKERSKEIRNRAEAAIAKGTNLPAHRDG